MASQITSLTIVYSTVYSGRSKKTSKLRVTGLCARNSPGTGEFPAQVTRKMFPFDDVIMNNEIILCTLRTHDLLAVSLKPNHAQRHLGGLSEFCTPNQMIANEAKTNRMILNRKIHTNAL